MTGGVDRPTGYEPGVLVQERLGSPGWEPDPLVLDDQALVAHVRDWGLVDGTGCGHAVVVNTCRHATRLTSVDRLCAVAGGFHLSGPLLEPLIEMVSADLQRR